LIIELDSKYEKLTGVIELELEPGNCSEITFVRNRETGEVFAVKTLTVPQKDRDKVQKQFMSEVLALNELRHPCIVRLKGYCLPSQSEGPKVIMEYVGGGTLKKVLRSDIAHPKWWDPTRKVIAVVGIVLGMNFIHSKGFIHRDLKPTNILLDEGHRIKISDFGSSRIYEADVTMSNVGTPLYMAPEASETTYDLKVDVYSFGLILYEIVSGTGALSSCTRGDRVKLFVSLQSGNRPDIPESVLPITRELIEKCWSASPAERPSFKEIWERLKEVKFKILSGVDTGAVEEFILMVEKGAKE
jgi:serine/threonine protein kinase